MLVLFTRVECGDFSAHAVPLALVGGIHVFTVAESLSQEEHMGCLVVAVAPRTQDMWHCCVPMGRLWKH